MAPRSQWSEQAHIDLGALSQRVTGVEGSISDIGGQLRDLSKKLDSKPTNWWGIIAGLVGLLGLVGGFFTQAIQPITAVLDRHERYLEKTVSIDAYEKDRENSRRAVDLAAQREEAATTEREKVKAETLARLDKSVDRITELMATRAELEAQARRSDERINAIAAGMHDLAVSRPALTIPIPPPGR